MELDTTVYRLPIIVSAIFGIVVWAYWIGRNKGRGMYAVLPLSYLIHLIVFLVVSELYLLEKSVYVTWHNAVMLHSVLVFIISCIGMIFIEGRIWTHR